MNKWVKVLKINDKQMKKALQTKDTKRIIELTLHKSLVKDCLIKELTKRSKK